MLQVLIFFSFFFFSSLISPSNKSHKSLRVNAVFLEGGGGGGEKYSGKFHLSPLRCLRLRCPIGWGPLSPLPACPTASLPPSPPPPNLSRDKRGSNQAVHPSRAMGEDPQPLLVETVRSINQESVLRCTWGCGGTYHVCIVRLCPPSYSSTRGSRHLCPPSVGSAGGLAVELLI